MADPDFKDPPRYVATAQEWAQLHVLLCPPGTKCFCGCRRTAHSLHHLLNRSQGGDDVPGNLVPLSGDGVALCHGALTTANRTYDYRTGEWIHPEQVRRRIGRKLCTYHLSYLDRKKGMAWVNKIYRLT